MDVELFELKRVGKKLFTWTSFFLNLNQTKEHFKNVYLEYVKTRLIKHHNHILEQKLQQTNKHKRLGWWMEKLSHKVFINKKVTSQTQTIY